MTWAETRVAKGEDPPGRGSDGREGKSSVVCWLAGVLTVGEEPGRVVDFQVELVV